MKIDGSKIKLSASDLANHLVCKHITTLDLLAARGEIQREYREDPRIDALIERGKQHELAYLKYLEECGLEVVRIDADRQQTIDAMKRGADAIAQGYLTDGRWHGYPDVLLKVDKPSALGAWSYEAVDTKLASETRGGAILQLCLYSELVANIQGVMPELMYIVTPKSVASAQIRIPYRTHDYLAYHNFIKSRLVSAIELRPETYPEPIDHCEICNWWLDCNQQRRADDHLSFVAGISKLQIRELKKLQVHKLAELPGASFPQRPQRGSIESYERIREQARLQLLYRNTKQPVHEILELQPEQGLARLPAPSAGDLFFDFESDPFVEGGGMEYLLGFLTVDGSQKYQRFWALNRTEEKQLFESFIDFVMERWQRFPDMHLYHYTHYEPAALKRLAGRYATREDELDRMLRAGLLVDLHAVVKQSLRASVERYSLKDLELFSRFERKTDLRDASRCLRNLECALELNAIADLPEDVLQTVESYNYEDCASTLALRNWLEGIRSNLVAEGKSIERPAAESPEPSETVAENRQRVLALMERLLTGIPSERTERTSEQQAVWLIAYMLEWHRREDKAMWWEYFRLKGLSDEELMEERCAISGLEFVERVVHVGGKIKSPVDRYRFPLQELDIHKGDKLETRTEKFGEVDAIDKAARTIDIKKKRKMADVHPRSAFVFDYIKTQEQRESLYRLGSWIADHGIDRPGSYCAARDLLLRNRKFDRSTLEVSEEAKRLVMQLDHTVLPVQGPPGAGKTYTGARMICELLRNHKRVGITAMSHKVIRKLLDEVVKAAKEENMVVQCIQKTPEQFEECAEIIVMDDNAAVLNALMSQEAQVAAGTAWLWSREEFAESVDVLFVDEAGQMSLADVLAVSHSAKSMVLLGDPRQLEQPLQGTHPPGVAVSALQHILGEEQTMPRERGLFLEHTWRLAPSICKFTSELFYENRLQSHAPLINQRIEGPSRFAGSGLLFVAAEHEGNQSSSDEEAGIVADIVRDLLQPDVVWFDMDNKPAPLKLENILIVAPYNAQVFKLLERIPDGCIGTVDKFQGQQAPVVIYSMTTSSPEDAPRGMEFLYSLNRFNVATSRARCICILVASPRLFEPECKTPRQMQLANVLCRYLELATMINHRGTETQS